MLSGGVVLRVLSGGVVLGVRADNLGDGGAPWHRCKADPDSDGLEQATHGELMPLRTRRERTRTELPWWRDPARETTSN